MNQLTELMIDSATGILAILAGMIVHMKFDENGNPDWTQPAVTAEA